MPSFTLRPYQESFATRIIQHLAKYRQVVACAATGAGKSKTFIYLADRAQQRGITVLVVTESSKIYSQLAAEFTAREINAKVKGLTVQPGVIYVAMAQTLSKRPVIIEQFKALGNKLLIINDEAHIGTATKLLKQFIPASMMIGFTATPDFESAKHLPELYQAIVVGAQPDELVQGGYLTSYQHFARVPAELDALKIKAGEFTEESQEQIFETAKVYLGLLDDLAEIPYKKAMIFTASIKHCQHVSEELLAHNIPCIQVHSKVDPAQQAYDMHQYLNGTINVAVSVGILTKGWDYPPLDLVVLLRATTSLPLYMQMMGRGSRIYADKKLFTVLDYGGNWKRLGLWDQEVDWAEKWNKKRNKKQGGGVAPVKNCPECEYIMTASKTKCPNCGYEFEAGDVELSPEQTKLIELTAGYRTLIGRTIGSLTPQELAMYAKLKNKKAYAIRVAKSLYQAGQSHYLNTFAQAMGYKPFWATRLEMDLQNEVEPIPFHDITLR